MSFSSLRKILADFAVIAIFATVYFLAAKFGLLLAVASPSASGIWPPTGLTLAALLVLGYRIWPGIFLGAFFANITTDGNLFTSLAIGVGNTLEGLVGAYLILRFANGIHVFERVRDCFVFTCSGAIMGPVFSATIGVTALALGGYIPFSNYEFVWVTWWLGNAVSALVLAPLLILWLQINHTWSWQKIFEFCFFLVTFVLILDLVFNEQFIGDYGFPIFTMPWFVWVAMRFSPRETATALILAALFSAYATLMGTGPFSDRPLGEALLHVQLFMSVIAITSLMLSAAVLERRKSDDALREADRRKDEFLASLSHELRNPLASMYGYLQLLQLNTNRSDDEKHAIDQMAAEVRHTTVLLEDLLDLSRIRRGRMHLNETAIEAAELVRQSAAGMEAMIREHKHTLEVKTPSHPVWIKGDRNRIKQIVSNLLNNSAKYTEPGGHIKLVLVSTMKSASIAVEDTGAGLAAERLERILSLDGSKNEESRHPRSGLGIGLALVKRLVDLHRATITAESDGPGTGCVFTVTFPLLPEKEIPPTASKRKPTETNDSRSILIVDDNEKTADVLAELLRHHGHRTHVAYTGSTALERVAAHHFDVVILDIALPDMSGYDVALEIKRRAGFGEIPVLLALSGYGTEDDIQRSYESGFSEHLVKPVDTKTLEQVLRRHV